MTLIAAVAVGIGVFATVYTTGRLIVDAYDRGKVRLERRQ